MGLRTNFTEPEVLTLDTTGNFTLTVTGNASVSGTSTGDVTLAGENYLSIAAQVITAAAVNLSGTHATGTLAAARLGTFTGDITTPGGSYATTLANNAVTTAKILDENVTLAKLVNASGASVLLGRGSAAGAGDFQEITMGLGISMSGTSLIETVVATYQASPPNPAGTSSTTGLMMGLAGTITPTKSGKVLFIVSGTIKNDTGDSGAKVQIRYGTGAAPANADALTGTTVGGLVQLLMATGGASTVPPIAPFSVQGIVSGLSVATAYWFDVGLASITSGTSTITDVSISAIEI